MKQCTHCKEYKEFNEFHWRKDVNDHRADCKSCCSIITAKRYDRNKVRKLLKSKEWYENNKDKRLLDFKLRSLMKIDRVPLWANRAKIQIIYKECRELNKRCGFVKYHVDHEIPLQGELVSGLHVETNLRILEKTLNLKKGNKYAMVA